MKETLANNFLMIVLIGLFGFYFLSGIYRTIHTIMMRIAFSSRTKRTGWIRQLYWPHVRCKMREYIGDHCRYLVPYGGAVECIALHELDRLSFKFIYLEEGMDKLKVEVLTKTEQITMFVIEWKAAYQVATTKEMLSLYLIETKNE